MKQLPDYPTYRKSLLVSGPWEKVRRCQHQTAASLGRRVRALYYYEGQYEKGQPASTRVQLFWDPRPTDSFYEETPSEQGFIGLCQRFEEELKRCSLPFKEEQYRRTEGYTVRLGLTKGFSAESYDANEVMKEIKNRCQAMVIEIVRGQLYSTGGDHWLYEEQVLDCLIASQEGLEKIYQLAQEKNQEHVVVVDWARGVSFAVRLTPPAASPALPGAPTIHDDRDRNNR